MASAQSSVLQSEELPLFDRKRTIQLAASGTALIAVCYGLARFAYGLFLPSFRNTFELSGSVAGGIASGSYLAYCVGVILSTLLTPRLGAKALAVSAGILATVGTTLIALTPNVTLLTIGVIIAGSSTGVASPPLAHAISYRVNSLAKDRVQAIANAGTGAGVLISGPIALLAQEQWRPAWFIFAALSALVTLWVAFIVPTQPRLVASQDSSTASPKKALLPDGAWRLIIASALMGAASAATWTFGQELITSVGQHERTPATIAWIAVGACGLLGGAAGDLIHRLGYRWSWILLMLALSLSTLTLALACTIYPLAFLASGLFGAAYIALTGLLLVWSTQVYTDSPSFGVGLSFLLIALGQAIASPLLGMVNDALSMTHTFWLAGVLALVGIAAQPQPSAR